MSRFLNPVLVQQRLKQTDLKLFTLNDFRIIFGVSPVAAKKFIEKYTKRGVFVRLKRGLFMLADNAPDQYTIANKIYEPSYISFDAALSYHKVIPESIYALTSATTKATRSFEVSDNLYHYHKIKKSVFTGYKSEHYDNATILMAEPEKAMADLLYFISLGKRELHYERIDVSKLQKKLLISYIKTFNKPQMLNLMEEIYALSNRNKRTR